MCAKVPNLYNECVDMCNLDYDAIESYDSVKTEVGVPKTQLSEKERREVDKVMLMATVLGGVVLLSGIIYLMNVRGFKGF